MQSSVYFFMQNRKKKQGIFLVHFDSATCVCSCFHVGRKEQRNYLVLFSGRTERKMSFLFISPCNVCVFIRQNEKNREITLFLCKAEQKVKRNFSCSFFLATPRFAFIIAVSLSDIELRDLFEDS